MKTHTFTIFTYFHSVHHVPLRFRPPLFHSSFVYMFPQLAQWQPTTKDISMVLWLWHKCEKMSDTPVGYLLGVHRSVARPPSREILSFLVCSTSWAEKKMWATRIHRLRKSKNAHSHAHATHVRRCFSLRVDLRGSSTTVLFYMYVCISAPHWLWRESSFRWYQEGEGALMNIYVIFGGLLESLSVIAHNKKYHHPVGNSMLSKGLLIRNDTKLAITKISLEIRKTCVFSTPKRAIYLPRMMHSTNAWNRISLVLCSIINKRETWKNN